MSTLTYILAGSALVLLASCSDPAQRAEAHLQYETQVTNPGWHTYAILVENPADKSPAELYKECEKVRALLEADQFMSTNTWRCTQAPL